MTRIGGVFNRPMAEFVFGQIICHERKFRDMDKAQQKKKWVGQAQGYSYRKLESLTLGILGFGEIGRQIASTGIAFGMNLAIYTRDVTKINCNYSKMTAYSSLGKFLPQCDYLVNVLPSTTATREMLNAKNISNCKKGAVLINVGRGDFIKEDVILSALDCEYFSAVVLDVFKDEPLSPSSKMWDHPKIVISPHVAALSFADDVAQIFEKKSVALHFGKCINHEICC
eukprot:TRINITY_DN21764_c0_g1_i1.p1 TRINITY_DN21764_c0_g1~~TRINITY_DN21764_c0_g1_i1.p1  ORF type:complete len:227 (-),score=20.57 TRINITY_DN21764_c0_g1_i1:27-707(-)